MKEFKTYEEQLKILESRGLIIQDRDFAMQKLKEENYYNIINGYKDLFLIKGAKDQFISGTTFEEIYALYDFDRVLKNILFKPILEVENILRSLIAYNFSEKYGNDNYLKIDNFETLKNSGCTPKKYEERINKIQELLSKLQSDIAYNISKKAYMNHYILTYGFVPLWVLVNCLTLGRLSQFYSLMNQNIRQKVSMNWNVLNTDLDQYIKNLAYYRNLCAHDERLFNAKNNQSIGDTIYHQQLNIPKINGRYIMGKDDIFSLIITLKILLPKEDFKTMCNKIEGRLRSLSQKLTVINISKVKECMGIPTNWISIK